MRSPDSTSNSVTAVPSTFSTSNIRRPSGYSDSGAAQPSSVMSMGIVVTSPSASLRGRRGARAPCWRSPEPRRRWRGRTGRRRRRRGPAVRWCRACGHGLMDSSGGWWVDGGTVGASAGPASACRSPRRSTRRCRLGVGGRPWGLAGDAAGRARARRARAARQRGDRDEQTANQVSASSARSACRACWRGERGLGGAAVVGGGRPWSTRRSRAGSDTGRQVGHRPRRWSSTSASSGTPGRGVEPQRGRAAASTCAASRRPGRCRRSRRAGRRPPFELGHLGQRDGRWSPVDRCPTGVR